jgi:anthranilate synthase/aminodeoxychorismate synthase-like glutamine amidotransferase
VRVLVIDNYDSFTYNLVQYLGELGAQLEVVRNDRASVEELLAGAPDRVVVSPGPCTPDEAGVSLEVVRRFPQAGIPTLGVCLGHQAIVEAFGGEVGYARELLHGKASPVHHDGSGLFTGLPEPFDAGRYHSLAATRLPDELLPTAYADDGEVMAVRHRTLPVAGVQFHPESVLTPDGPALARNFLEGRL